MSAREEAIADVHAGYRLHYLEPGDDPDLALLEGDRRYAAGLERLAAEGDLVAVAVLADVIARCAEAHASGRFQDAEVVWRDGANALGTRPPENPKK